MKRAYFSEPSNKRPKRSLLEVVFLGVCKNGLVASTSFILHKNQISKRVLNEALTISCLNGHASVAMLLIEHGAKIHGRYQSIIKTICELGHSQIIQLFINLKLNLQYGNNAPFRYACQYNRPEIASMLIHSFVEAGANISECISNKLFLKACRKGYTGIAKILLEYGANINAENGKPLCEACTCGNMELVKLLISCGANVNAENGTPLCEASSKGHLELVELLLNNGAEINCNNSEALKCACIEGKLQIVRFLVEHGANIHECNNIALVCACLYGRLEIVKYLHEKGGILVSEALECACRKGYLEVVKYLVENGANVLANNYAAAKWAKHNGHQEVFVYMLEQIEAIQEKEVEEMAKQKEKMKKECTGKYTM